MNIQRNEFENEWSFWQRLVYAILACWGGLMTWAVIVSEVYVLVPLLLMMWWVLLSTKTHFNRVMRKLHAPKFMLIKQDNNHETE